MAKKLRTIVLYLLAAFPVFLVLVGTFTQTQLFRDRLRAVALAELDSLFQADVRLGSLRGNLVTGFSIDSIAIDIHGRPFLRLARLDLAYNVFALPGRTIAVKRLTLHEPEVFFYRPAGGTWNIADLIRHRPVDTTGGTPFEWVVRVRALEIRNGTFALLDSAGLAAEGHEAPDSQSVEYHRFTVRRVNMVLAADIGHDWKKVVVSSCSFAADEPAVELRHLSGVFTLTPFEARAESLHVVTGRTDLTINAAMKDIDLLGGINLRALQFSPVDLSLRAHPLDFDELKKFITPISFLAGTSDIELNAGGQFGDFAVRQLDIRLGSSALYVRGSVANLHTPGKLLLTVKITESTLVPSDVTALMPPFDLSAIDGLGTMTLNLEFSGSPVDFHTKFLLETAGGKVQSSEFALAIGGSPTLRYDGTILFSDLDLRRVLDDAGLPSRLNGMVVLKGQGVSLRNLASTVTVQMDSSEFRGLPIGKTSVALEALRRTITLHGALALGDMSATLAGQLREPEGMVPTFTFGGEVTSLNLEHILHDSTYNSNITLKLNAEGSGLSWNSLNGSMVVDLSSSRFREYTVTEGDLHLSIDQRDSLNKQLQFDSNIADFSLTGEFDLGYMLKLIPFEVQNVRAAAIDKIMAIDSSLGLTLDRTALERRARDIGTARTNLDARYILSVKDLEPLSVAAGQRTFDATGLLTGKIRGNYDSLSINGDLTIDDFFYGDADAGILIEDGKADFAVDALTPTHPLKDAMLRLDASAGKVHLNRNTLDSLELTFAYGRERATYAARTAFNKDLRLHTSGSAGVDENSFTVGLSSLDLSYRDYSWHADSGATFRVSHAGAALGGLLLQRDSQSVAIEGTLKGGRSIDASIEGKHLTLDALRYLLSDEELGAQGKAFTGVAQVSGKATGTLDDPVVSVSVDAENITFRTLPFGAVAGDLRYAQGDVETHLRVSASGPARTNSAVMTVEGTLPWRSAGGGEGTLGDRPMSLHIVSRGVQLGILDPLLPTFNELTGVMTCDVTLQGSLQHPTYGGTLQISGCSFLFVPNNIYYLADGTFQPEGDRIKVEECIIRNIPEDKRGGRQGLVRLAGDFALRDLRPGDFNLTAEGQLLVVKETTRKSSLEVYGDLFAEIGPGPLHFTGEIENSLLQGRLLIRNSSLIFPPTQSTVVQESPESVPVAFVNDTLKVSSRRDRSASARYFGESAAGRDATQEIELRRSRSFTDGLHYDLDIETGGGNTEIRMLFNPATSEELVATLDGRFTITEDGRKWTGDLTVNRAYYNFFKRFDATGSIRFTGDLLDPELNIRATYRGNRTLTDSTAVSRQEPVVVTVKITGTRHEPKIEFSMTIDEVDYYTYKGLKSNDIQSDAVQFIVAGTFPLTATQRNELVSQTAGLSLLTGATSLLTGSLSEFLRTQTGFINTVELSYGGKESTELRLSGTAWNGYWRYGGQILNDPLSNANISILYSFGTIFNNPTLRNLMFELERRVEPGTLGVNDLRRVNSGRIYYRFSF